MADDNQTRDRVRALVREVLATATTVDDESPTNQQSATNETTAANTRPQQSTPLIDLRPHASAATDASEQTYTRDESAMAIITEADVRDLERNATLRIGESARLTALAEDIVRERNITLVRRAPRRSSANARTKIIAVGADHGGFEMKETLRRLLADEGYQTRDFGTHSTDAVDYPDIAHAVASAVASHEADLGIVIDGAGVGSAMTANKVPGVRAAACYTVAVAKNSREHNDANVLTLGSKTITTDEMREIVKAWLTTELTEERHRKRVAKIEAIERQYRN
jgi:ribose 5-phosphate isomerase B